MEKPFLFRAGEHELSGILHLPEREQKAPELGVVFVHAGARGRYGNTFQYPYYARALAKQGIPSLRFDPHGMGDSEGHIEIAKVLDFYGTIQAGRFAQGTLAAIDEFHRVVAPKKLVLFGICGGAITALLAAPRARRPVDGLVLLSCPALMDSSQQSQLERIPAGYAKDYLIALYAKKVFSLAAWRRLLTFQSDTSTMWTYGRAVAKGMIDKARERVRERVRPTPKGAEKPPREKNPRFNDLFLEATEAMLKRHAKLLFLFGDGDALRWDFQKEFYDVYWKGNATYERHCEVHYLAGCNHLFTLREWQRQALEVAGPWLERL